MSLEGCKDELYGKGSEVLPACLFSLPLHLCLMKGDAGDGGGWTEGLLSYMVSVGDQLWDCGSEMGPLPLCCLTSSLFFLPQDDAGVLHASLTLSSLTSPTQERLPSPLPTGNHRKRPYTLS